MGIIIAGHYVFICYLAFFFFSTSKDLRDILHFPCLHFPQEAPRPGKPVSPPLMVRYMACKTDGVERLEWVHGAGNIMWHTVSYMETNTSHSYFFSGWTVMGVDKSWTELIYPHECFPQEGMMTGTLSLLPSPWSHLDSFDPLSTLLGSGRLQVIMNFVCCDDLKQVLIVALLAWWERKHNNMWVPETHQPTSFPKSWNVPQCPKKSLHLYSLPKDTFSICKDSYVVWSLRNT